MDKQSASTTVSVSQQAGLITGGGRVIGVAVENLTGDIFFNGPATNPPNLTSLVAYLQQVHSAAPSPEVAEMSKALKYLWNLPFHAHLPGQNGGDETPLADTVKEMFARDRALQRGERVVILAEPGMGKTPSLKELRAVQAQASSEWVRKNRDRLAEESEEFQPEPGAFIVPLLIDLAQLNSGLSLYALLASAFNRYIRPNRGEQINEIGLGQVPDFLNSTGCLILMDNLDALISNRRSNGLLQVRMFMEVHHEHQYVIACRTSSYREQLGPLKMLYLDDLTSDKVCDVLAQSGTDCAQVTESMFSLARNRGMLALILKAHERDEVEKAAAEPEAARDKEQGGNPFVLENKGQLFRLRMDQRLTEGHNKELHPALSLLVGTLEHLAYTMHRMHTLLLDEQRVMNSVRAYLETWHEATHWREVLDTLAEMGLLERGDRWSGWRFCERTDQAYFTAMAIVSEPERIAPVLQEMGDYWWREMFEILVGLIPDPTALFFELIDGAPLQAANSLQYAGGSVHGSVTSAVIDALVEYMDFESSFRRKYIVERIGESKHARAGEALFLAYHKEWSSLVLKAIARALAAWAAEQADPQAALEAAEEAALRQRLDDVTHVAPVVACYTRSLAENTDQSKVRRELENILADKEAPARSRGLAALYLAQLSCRQASGEETWAPLLTLFKPDSNCAPPQLDIHLAWCVTEALTDSLLPAVEEAARALAGDAGYCSDAWCDYRGRGLYLLGWISHQKDLDTLLDKALTDSDPLVRGFAIDATTRLDLPGTREKLHEMLSGNRGRATSSAGQPAEERQAVAPIPETNPEVLRRIAEALAQIGTAESIPMLDRYLQHERTRTRLMMKKAIAEIRERYGLWSG